jgi:hypothetical protein
MLACGPDPPLWPARFAIEQRKIPDDGSGNSTTLTFYDSVYGANLILITPDSNQTDVLWDLELNTGRSYYFTPARRTCHPMRFPVGILARDWLRNATYLGVRPCPFATRASRCAAWTKGTRAFWAYPSRVHLALRRRAANAMQAHADRLARAQTSSSTTMPTSRAVLRPRGTSGR